MFWRYSSSELFTVGDQVEVVVLKFDRETERVSLGYKQLSPDPWDSAQERFPDGSPIKGKVVSLTDYGAFVELEPGVEGLIHVSEMSWSKKVKHPSKILNVGQEVECAVLGIDQEAHRISLGLKQVEQNPWEQLVSKYPVGSKIEGKVRNLTEFGAFVEVEEGIDGLIHISDMSWTKRVQHPSEVVKKGDTVDVIILNIDSDNKRISLGLKQATEDPWLSIGEHYPVGTELRGTVARLMDKGVVVDIGNDIEGFVPLSHIPSEKPIDSPADVCYETMILDLRIVEVDPIHRRIVLTVVDIPADQPPRPETPSKIHTEDEAPIPDVSEIDLDEEE